MQLKGRNFLKLMDYTPEEITYLIENLCHFGYSLESQLMMSDHLQLLIRFDDVSLMLTH